MWSRFAWVPVALLPLAVSAEQESGPSGPDERLRFSSGYEAYQAGDWEEALRRFSDLELRRPDDYEVKLNLGSALYRSQSYQEAVRRYNEAATSGDQELRAEALYNLGNVAYRQQDLPQAEQFYKSALELKSDDQDAKFNLEYVRREMEQQNEQQPKQDPEQDPQSEQQEDASDSSNQSKDSDEDGLPDETERQGRNPTDPENPDSDGDGLRDGEEDVNANGQVDSGETDPNLADTDGDGRSDSEEDRQPESSAAEQMSEEEAQRYLQALEDKKPPVERRPANRRRQSKDW